MCTTPDFTQLLTWIICYWTLNVCVDACFTNCGASFPPFPSLPLPPLSCPSISFPLSLLLSLSFPLLSPSSSLSSSSPPTSFLLPQVEQLAEEIQSLQQQLRRCLKDRTQVKTLQLIPGGQRLVHVCHIKYSYPPNPHFCGFWGSPCNRPPC